MSELWSTLRQRGVLAAIDVELARALGRLGGEERLEVLLGVALASRQTREGHVCVELERFAGAPIRDLEGNPLGDRRFPELSSWRAALACTELVGDGSRVAPLVMDRAGRLYLTRYFEHEQRLAELVRERNGFVNERFDAAVLRQAVDRLFTDPAPDHQRAAAEVALLRHLTVVSGGPGTGKTSTVVKILALLVESARAMARAAPRVALLAPTGKAATRLGESIARAKAHLPCAAEVVQAIPEAASTIHRELRARGDGGTRFERDRDNPLAADVVVVDESSMVDVALMRRLFEAVSPSARLILLGDEHQLASVEAGAVLGDVCRAAPLGSHSKELSERVRAAFGESLPRPPSAAPSAIGDCVVRLEKSHRFSGASAIGQLASAIHRGDEEQVIAALAVGGDVELVEPRSPEALSRALAAAARRGFTPYLESEDPARALTELERFRVLCAHRRGFEGAESVNLLIERALDDAGLIARKGHAARWYRGRPLIVTQNDYALGLFNGDVGTIVDTDQGARAYFVTGSGPRLLAPSRLPPHETVFATSIHKSQGSEFDEVAIVLPDERSPLLTRELFYTAVTRARSRVLVFGSKASVREAVKRRIQRATGLTEALG